MARLDINPPDRIRFTPPARRYDFGDSDAFGQGEYVSGKDYDIVVAQKEGLVDAVQEVGKALWDLMEDYELMIGDGVTGSNQPAPLRKARAIFGFED